MRLLIPLLFFVLLGNGASAAIRQIDSTLIVSAPKVTAIASDSEGNIYTADEEGIVRVLSPAGETLRVFARATADGRPTLKRPRGIAVAGERVFVADAKLDQVVLFDRSGNWLGTLGSGGSDPKEFDTPSAVAVSCGVLLVADTDNRRLQVFSLDGIYLATIGRSGDDDARLTEPTHVAAGPDGRIVILDDGKVKLFRPTGEFLKTLAIPYEPVAIAADAEGILLADADSLKVIKVDYEGNELFSFGSKGKERSQFLGICSLGLSPGGRLLVGDQKKGVVHVLTAHGGSSPPDVSPPLTSVRLTNVVENLSFSHVAAGQDGTVFGIVEAEDKYIAVLAQGTVIREIRLPKWNPVALAVASDGSLWTIDARDSAILHLSADGKILGRFGSSGSKDGCFDTPVDLLVSRQGLIYVADRDNERVQIFNPDGVLLHIIGGAQQDPAFDSPSALALDAQGHLFVLDSDRMTVSIFDPDGRPVRTFGGRDTLPRRFVEPVSLTVTANEVQVLDRRAGSVQVFSHRGEFLRSYAADGSDSGDLSRPGDIIALNDTEFLIADSGNRRLQTFQMIYSPPPPLKLGGTSGQRLATLNWQPSAETYVIGYKVYRSTSRNGYFVEIARTEEPFLSDDTVDPDTSYFYRVTAVAKDGWEGAPSRTIEVVPTKIVPSPPLELKASPQEWSIDLDWTTEKPDIVSEYRIYRWIKGKETLVGTSKSTKFYDSNLEPQATYRYSISAVSIDGIESPLVSIRATTLATTRPPLEIVIEKLEDIFSNSYKSYETKGIGIVKIINNTRDQLSRIKVAFMLKDFMDYPSEVEISNLDPRVSETFSLPVVFNNSILNLTEDATVQGELVASYYINQNLVQCSLVQPIRIFEKHRMLWDEHERFAAFVTPKDPVILEFGRAVASQYSEFADPILFAGVVFDALGVLGVGYLQDPSNPYQLTSEQTDLVDFIQYPRETLARKSGDCDDLVGLYSSILESLGIRTQVIEVPGHMFLMFETNLMPGTLSSALTKMYIEQAGRLWVPVEVTKVGSSFMKAWEAGLKNYHAWEGENRSFMDVRAAWGDFKPATLPMSHWRAPAAAKEEIDKRFKDDLPTLRKIRLQNHGQHYLARLQTDAKDGHALLQLGILYARAGEPKEAVGLLDKACSLLPGHSAAHNNIGNVYFMLEDYAKAEFAYRKAAELDDKDPDILINLARVQLRLENPGAAKETFRKATLMQPDITERYRPLAINLGFSL